MSSADAPLLWERLPTVEQLPLAAARRAHRLFTYARSGHDGRAIVVVVVVDRRESLLARSSYATSVDPRRVAERVLEASVLGRCSPYRADSAHRESRIEALVGPMATPGLGTYERLLRDRRPRTA